VPFDEDNGLKSVERRLDPADEICQDSLEITPPPDGIEGDSLPPAATQSPVRVIDDDRWTGLELRDLWVHRELFYFLVWRDI
jgi:hypothetical protein